MSRDSTPVTTAIKGVYILRNVQVGFQLCQHMNHFFIVADVLF